MNIKRSINFNLEKRKKEGKVINENVPIRVSVFFMGNRILTNAGYRIDKNKWDKKKQRAKAGAVNKKGERDTDINSRLNGIETDVNNFFKDCELAEKLPTKEEVRNIINKPIVNQIGDSSSVVDMYDKYIQKKSRSWTNGTVKKHRVVRNHLQEFNPLLKLKEVNRDTIDRYIDYLIAKKYRNVSIKKDIKCLKSFLNWCFERDLYNGIKTLKYKLDLKGLTGNNRKIIYLTLEELERLETFPLTTEKQKRVRDVFIFCCYSGIRYSDVFNLKKTDVFSDKIIFTTKKTEDTLEVDLNTHSRRILDRYKDIPFKDGKALPVISNQKTNDYLKQICKKAGIDTPVTDVYFIGKDRHEDTFPKYALIGTHAGRRTFVTLSLLKGIPTEVIMKWTGHSDHKAMEPYLDIVDNLKKKEMKKWD